MDVHPKFHHSIMYGRKDEGFFITLPSNASLNVFKANKSSSYRVDLAQHIDLEGQWEVALTEISYPHTWYTIERKDAYFHWREKPVEPGKEIELHYQTFGGGYYAGVLAFKTELNSHFRKINSDINLVFSTIQKRFDFQGGGQTQIRFDASAAYMVGLNPGEWFKMDQKLAPYPPDIKVGFYHLYCYSDVVCPQLVGDTYAPLLRTLDIQGTFGDVITQYFNPAYYLPVAKQHIENIQIEIKSDQNKLVNFKFGKTIVTLHFRPKKN